MSTAVTASYSDNYAALVGHRSSHSTPVTATDTATTLDRLCIDTIRTLSMDAVQKANSGHPGTPMALAPVGYLLYARVMRHNPRDPQALSGGWRFRRQPTESSSARVTTAGDQVADGS